MTGSSNVGNNVNAAQNHPNSILPDNFDAKTLKDFFSGLLENAKPGDRDALQALLGDLDKLANISARDGDSKGIFGKVFDKYRDNINQNLVPFLETIANNPGAFGTAVPPGLNLDQTMDYIVNNAPPHLQPLMADLAKDIKSFTKTNSDQGIEIANLMAYLVNKGNAIVDANPPGSAIGGVGGDSPNGVGPGNIVDGQKSQMSDTSATIAKGSEALKLISEIIADPSKLTPANIQKLAHIVADVISDIAAAGGDTSKAEMIAKQVASLGMKDGANASDVQRALGDLLQTLTQQLLDDAKRAGKSGGGRGAPKGAPGGAAPVGGAGGAEGGEAVGGAEGAGGSEAVGGSESSGSSGSAGLSIFEIIAKALGDKMTAKLREMKSFADQISSISDNPSGDQQADSAEIAGLSAQLGAASQEFSLISNSFSTTIKALGEGTKAAVRYS